MDPYTADTVLAHMCMQYGPLHSRYSAGTYVHAIWTLTQPIQCWHICACNMDPYTADTVLAHMCMQYGPLHSRYSAGTCTFLKRLKSLNFPPSLAATDLLPRPSRCSTTTTSLTTSTHSGTEGVEPGSCDMLKNAPLGTCRKRWGGGRVPLRTSICKPTCSYCDARL